MIDNPLSGPDPRGSIRVASGAATHVGHVRSTNEDSLLEAPPIFLVADGMGGHNAGEVASAIAVEEFEKLTAGHHVTIEQLGDALAIAARRIADLGGDAHRAAGTTVALVATVVIDEVGYWVVMNLGDSRVYRLSNNIFEQVSVDHSVVQELVDRGEITAEDARVHPHRHMVTRALGAGPEADPDYWLIPAEVGDRMLVCSDGLSGEVPDSALERLLRNGPEISAVCEELVELALAAGGHDNITVVAVEATEVVGFAQTERTATRDADVSAAGSVEVDGDTPPRSAPRSNGNDS